MMPGPGAAILAGSSGAIGGQLSSIFGPLGNATSQLAGFLAPNQAPTFAQILAPYVMGYMSARAFKDTARVNGIECNPIPADFVAPWDFTPTKRDELWRLIVAAQQTRYTAGDLNTLRNQGWLGRDEWNQEMRRLGIADPEVRDQLGKLLSFSPPVSDLIRFAVKDVFLLDQLPGYEEMRAELTEQKDLLALMRAQGIGDLLIKTPNGELKGYDVPLLYWLASFELPSPTQAYEMLHRLRPNRLAKWSLPGPDGRPILPASMSLVDLRALLKDKDYNPIYRDRLAAISYRTVGRIDLRRLYGAGIFGPALGRDGFVEQADGRITVQGRAEKELYESYLDAGYSDEDARRLSLWTAVDVTRTRIGRGRTRLLNQLCESYQLGTLTRNQAEERGFLGGFDAEEIRPLLDSCDVAAKLKLAKATLAAIRSAFLSGVIDSAAARGELAASGFADARIAEYINLWVLQKRRRPKEVSAQQLCEWRGMGLITDQGMLKRLQNLGYDEADSQTILRHCQLGHLAKGAKERERLLRAQLREQEKQARVIEQRQKAARAIEEQAGKRALGARTDKNLTAWWKKGLIDHAYIRLTLTLRGWLADDVERFILALPEQEKEGEQ